MDRIRLLWISCCSRCRTYEGTDDVFEIDDCRREDALWKRDVLVLYECWHDRSGKALSLKDEEEEEEGSALL